MVQFYNRKTVYDGLLGIRKHLFESLSRESANIVKLENILDSNQATSSLENVECTFTDGLRQIKHSMKYRTSNQSFTHIVEDVISGATTTTDYTLSQVRDGDTDEILNGVNSLVVNSDTNEAIASVNDLFLLHNKVNISVITSSLQDYANTNVKEYGTIVSTLSALSDAGGNISQLSWVQWCRRVFTVGLNAGEHSSFQLDETNPYKIINFINILVNSFGVLTNVIFSAIGSAFRGLLSLVVLVISSLASMWNAAKEKFGEVRIQDDEVLWHLAGSVITSVLKPGYHDMTGYDGLCHYIPLPGLDCYWWVDADDANALKCQCFINLSVHPDRLYGYLINTTSSKETDNYISVNSSHFMREDDELSDPDAYESFINMFLTEDEYSKLSTDGDFLRRTIACNLCCVGLCIAYFGQWQCGGGVSTYTPQFDENAGVYSPWIGLAQMAAIAFAEFKYRYKVDNGYQMFDKISWELCFRMHKYLFEYSNQTWLNWVTDDTTTVSQAGQAYMAYIYKSPIHGLLHLSAGSQYDIMVTTNYDTNASNSLDYFPVSPKIILPQLNFDAVLAWIVMSGIAITAAFMTVKLLTRNHRIARTVKRQRAANDLQEKYNRAVETGSPADMRAYIKAQKRFDLKSKVFHWDTYDVQNSWWEPRTVANNMSSLLTTTTAHAIATGVSAVNDNTNQLPGAVSSISQNITTLSNSITPMSNKVNNINNKVNAWDPTISAVNANVNTTKSNTDHIIQLIAGI